MVTEEQIDAWKKEHGEVFTLTVETKDGPIVGYLKPADRNVIARAMPFTMRQQLIEAGEIIIDNCFIGGDPSLKDHYSPVGIAASINAVNAVEILSGATKKN
jgi:hypothetical protein